MELWEGVAGEAAPPRLAVLHQTQVLLLLAAAACTIYSDKNILIILKNISFHLSDPEPSHILCRSSVSRCPPCPGSPSLTAAGNLLLAEEHF